jgi:Family of unknown function (DUF6526)
MSRLQSYTNHAHRPRLSGAAGLFAGIALGLFGIDLLRRPDRLTIGLVCLTIAVMCLVAISRLYIVRLQDRIILLEMRTRLMRLGHEADYGRLSKRQLISLRFASDAELPELLQRAMTENLTGKQIKAAIRDWQPDYHRT